MYKAKKNYSFNIVTLSIDGHNTNRRMMALNPIYDKGPLYDTIPTVSEKQTASSDFQTSALMTFPTANAYIDEPCHSSLQRKCTSSSLGNTHTTSCHIDLGSAAANCYPTTLSLENGHSGHATGYKGEYDESYIVMSPDATAAKSK